MIKTICKIVSLISLVVLVVPSCLYFVGKMELDAVKHIMTAATIFWFAAASMWMWNADSQT